MLRSTFDLDALDPAAQSPDVSAPDLPALQLECAARADIYRMLSGVFIEEPSIGLLQQMRQPSWLQAMQRVGLAFEADFLETDLHSLLDALACEYTTLFAASGGFPPVESVRLTGRYKQEPCHQVTAFYQRLGFVPGKARFEVFPDQLGVELFFVAQLLDRCALAAHNADLVTYKKCDKDIKKFWTLHLGRWVRGFAALVVRATNHSFYREMARFMLGFCQEEITAMGLSRLQDLDQARLSVPKSEISVEFNPDEPVCDACTAAENTLLGGPDPSQRVIAIRPAAASTPSLVSDLAF